MQRGAGHCSARLHVWQEQSKTLLLQGLLSARQRLSRRTLFARLAPCAQQTVCPLCCLQYWHETIAPVVKSGRNVIIAAHGNSLRALVSTALSGLRDTPCVMHGCSSIVVEPTAACCTAFAPWRTLQWDRRVERPLVQQDRSCCKYGPCCPLHHCKHPPAQQPYCLAKLSVCPFCTNSDLPNTALHQISAEADLCLPKCWASPPSLAPLLCSHSLLCASRDAPSVQLPFSMQPGHDCAAGLNFWPQSSTPHENHQTMLLLAPCR